MRIPHVVLDDGLSTLDLPGNWPLLLTRDAGWVAAARSLANAGAPIDISSPNGEWHARFGVGQDGALLVRPDGFVAWRMAEGGTVSPR